MGEYKSEKHSNMGEYKSEIHDKPISLALPSSPKMRAARHLTSLDLSDSKTWTAMLTARGSPRSLSASPKSAFLHYNIIYTFI